MCHSHLVNTSLFVIFTNQHLQNLDRSQNQMAIEVTLNTFFCHHKEKQKKQSGHARLISSWALMDNQNLISQKF